MMFQAPWADAVLTARASAQINDVTGNPFSPTCVPRLHRSPVVEPARSRVYEDGVRTNEAFGDTVNWTSFRSSRSKGWKSFSNNPAFGLNALGGALAIRMKNGFTFTILE